MARKKLCRCGKVIDYRDRYCNKCRVIYQSHYDKHIRNKKSTTFYNSSEWIKTREYILQKYKGLDLYAFFIEKKIVYAEAVHHIEELKEKPSRRLDTTNLIPLSKSNHNKIDGLYNKDKKGTQKLLFELLERWKIIYDG